MALIQCPECGNKISDRAHSCPHCGIPMGAGVSAPAPVNAIPPTPSPTQTPTPPIPKQGSVGMTAQSLHCPNCGEPIQTKDILTSGWARCPSCKNDFPLNGVNQMFSDEGLIEKIVPFGDTPEAFNQRVMSLMMQKAPADFFSQVTDIKVRRKYIWVREFGSGDDRQIYPMSKFGEHFFSSLTNDKNAIVNVKEYSKWYPDKRMLEFSSDLTAGAELDPREFSAKEVRHRYTINSKSNNGIIKDVYYCLPILVETFKYQGKNYQMMGIGSGVSDIFCWEEIPVETEVLAAKPNFFTANVVLTTGIIIVAILGLIGVIALFSEGFWTGLIWCIVIGIGISIVGTFVGSILALPLLGLDKIIQVSINTKRRRNFINRFKEIQDRKVAEAKRYHNLNFTYTVPQYPLP